MDEAIERTPTKGAGAIPVSDWNAPTLVNHDQLKTTAKNWDQVRDRLQLSPIRKTSGGREVARIYEDDEYEALTAGLFCCNCDMRHNAEASPSWVVTTMPQQCEREWCRYPRGKEYIARHPILFLSVTHVKNGNTFNNPTSEHVA